MDTIYSKEYSCTLFWKQCLQCGSYGYLKKAQKYCGKICMGLARRGSNNPAYYPKKFPGTMREYKRYHKRVRDRRGSATDVPCTNCGSIKFCTWANQTGNYADPNDYKVMCSKCHSDFDRGTELEVWPLPRNTEGKLYEMPKPHRIQFSNEQTARSGFGGDHDYFGLYTCSDCAALVLSDGFEKHRIFHDKMEELIGWAQAVSADILRQSEK